MLINADRAAVPPPVSNAATGTNEVLFVGPLPPPVTGMTAMSAVIVEAMRRRMPTTIDNWSAGKPLKGWRWRIARLGGLVKTLAKLPFRGSGRGKVLYFAVNSGAGMYYDLAIAALGRVLGYRLVLHHHAYSYIDRRDWRAAWLDRLVGSDGAHALHCSLMQEHFLAHYPSRAKFLFVPPTIVSQQLEKAEPRPHDLFTLGFMSNLSLAKGIDEAIATFERLAVEGRRVALILAGPCMGTEERALVDAALSRWPGQIEYRGPVYGAEKAQFFADVDVFLFPTRYRNESWGIVLTEALSVGCPVISRSRGCVPWIVRGDCGVVVPPDGDFVAAATERIAAWIDSPDQFQGARTAARRRSDELEEDASRELPAFVEQIATLGRAGGMINP